MPRYEGNLHKLNLVKEKIQSEKESLQAKLEVREREAHSLSRPTHTRSRSPLMSAGTRECCSDPSSARLEAERQAQVDLVIALQAEIRFAQSKYKAVREELAAAVVGWDHERKRVAEIQSYWHHNQNGS